MSWTIDIPDDFYYGLGAFGGLMFLMCCLPKICSCYTERRRHQELLQAIKENSQISLRDGVVNIEMDEFKENCEYNEYNENNEFPVNKSIDVGVQSDDKDTIEKTEIVNDDLTTETNDDLPINMDDLINQFIELYNDTYKPSYPMDYRQVMRMYNSLETPEDVETLQSTVYEMLQTNVIV